jgi:exodeoxyribonuclease V beta subunit
MSNPLNVNESNDAIDSAPQNNQVPQTLDVMTLPLQGERLIEASAGTGKTYTIAGLYLRLLLEHGGKNGHGRALTVDEILVVTFTEAATAELRDRIRSRIVETRHALICGVSSDPFIKELMAQINDHEGAAQILLQAIRQMDEAAIYTIHGFCQRMLKEHAFESGSYFETQFITDEMPIRQQAIEDFWREQFYHTNDEVDYSLAKLVRGYWASPEKLLGQLRGYLTNPFLTFEAPLSELPLKQAFGEMVTQINDFKILWSGASTDILPHLQASGVDKRSYSAKNLPKWCDEITLWAQTPTIDLNVPDNLARFDSQTLSAKTKKGEVPSLAIFDSVTKFLAQPLSLKPAILAKAIHFTREHVAAHKKQQALLSFDDLLSGLNNALNGNKEGSLATKIRTQYPLAMIDEFQDTDLMQYQIFNTIYGAQKAAGLLMIGDPKQAIYSFRGADIFTYIKARREVSNHYTLGTNYRSTPNMVAAVNGLFGQSDAPFIYSDDIGFSPVKSIEKSSQFTVDGQTQGAISQWLMPSETTVGNGQYQSTMALACASQINQLLSKGQLGEAGFCKDDSLRPVTASDIAILVRTGTEAKLIKQQLAKQGIASVYLSNRESIFSAPIISDVWRILCAVVEPNNARAIRSAMATQLMAQTINQLDDLNNDERLWQQLVDQFNYYQQRWQKVGVLAMLREFLHQQHIPSQLLGLVDGERQLTDLLHLGEILQQQSLEIVGEHALMHWLSDQIHNQQGEVQEQQLRLESDKNLVQIVTIHKSKGLEYNLLFLPFICSIRKAKDAIYHHNDETIVDLNGGEDALSAADKERLAEDLRLFYVAITRAVHHAWLGFAPLKNGKANKAGTTDLHASAVGYLYLGTEVTTHDVLASKLAAFDANFDFVNTLAPPSDMLTPYQAMNADEGEMSARSFDRKIENNYWITSYSALSKTTHHSKNSNVDASLESFDIDWEAALAQVNNDKIDEQAEQTIFTFPRGAHAGTFMHTLFEEIDFPHATGEVLQDKVTQLLEASEFDESWRDVLIKLVDDVLDSPLNCSVDNSLGYSLDESFRSSDLSPDFSLRQLGMKDKQVEMEFFMPLSALDCEDVNQVLTKHDALSKQANPLSFSKVQGMLKGFIDLIFVANGKYYVLDYKSNHLGDTAQNYDMAHMSDVMIDHRYDFQYQLYSLALHRLLRARLPNYTMEEHLGGAFYLFLRGMDKNSTQGNGIFYNRPSNAFIEELDELFSAKSHVTQGVQS